MPNEQDITEALSACERGDFDTLKEAALAYDVPYSTLTARARGRSTRGQAHVHQQLLTLEQEELLVEWIIDLDMYGSAPNHSQVRLMAGVICGNAGLIGEVGHHWLSRFLARHPEVQSKLGVRIDRTRCQAVTFEKVEEWFQWLGEVLLAKRIKRENTYNMDETGNALATCGNRMVVGSAQSTNSVVSTPTDREWCTAIECVSVDGRVLRPVLIFKGKTVQQQWFIPEEVPDWIFTAAKSGYTTNEIGLAWLKQVFIPESQPEGDEWRLLILDGHKSHITDEFMTTAYENKIWIHYLIPHSSHIFQPLDITVFGPLKRRFRALLSQFYYKGDMGVRRKQEFIVRYRIARETTLTRRNISAGFRTAGIHPFNKETALKSPHLIPPQPNRPTTPVRKQQESFELQEIPRTPRTPQTSRDANWELRNLVLLSPSDRNSTLAVRKITKAFEVKDVLFAQCTMELRTLQEFRFRFDNSHKRKQPVNQNQRFIDLADIQMGSHGPSVPLEGSERPKKRTKQATTRSKARDTTAESLTTALQNVNSNMVTLSSIMGGIQ